MMTTKKALAILASVAALGIIIFFAVGGVNGKGLGATLIQIQIPRDTILFLAGGFNDLNGNHTAFNDIYASPNMLNWNLISANGLSGKWLPRFYPETAYFNNKYWLIGGNNNMSANSGIDKQVWSSPDGVTWTNITINAPLSFSQYFQNETVVFNGKIWSLGGQNFVSGVSQGKTWSSSDGVIWNEISNNAPWGDRVGHTVISFNGKMYLMGGFAATTGHAINSSDVWSSSDGVTWNQITTNAPWGPLAYAEGIVYQNKMYLIGGSVVVNSGVSSVSPKIWSSFDGINWTLVSQNLPYTNIIFSEAVDVVVANGKIWLSDAKYLSGEQNHLWSTTDGVTWTLQNIQLPWSPRNGFRMIVKPGQQTTSTPIPSLVQINTAPLTKDFCPNISGIQSSVPTGYVVDSSGNCVKQVIITPTTLQNVQLISAASTVQSCTATMDPWIQIVSPNGGETYRAGQSVEVRWVSCNIPAGETVSLGLMSYVNNSTYIANLVNSTPNDGRESVVIGANTPSTNYPYGTFYRVRASSYGSMSGSQNLFTINQ